MRLCIRRHRKTLRFVLRLNTTSRIILSIAFIFIAERRLHLNSNDPVHIPEIEGERYGVTH